MSLQQRYNVLNACSFYLIMTSVIFFVPILLFATYFAPAETNLLFVSALCLLHSIIKFGIGFSLIKKTDALQSTLQQQTILQLEEKRSLITKHTTGYKIDIIETVTIPVESNTWLYTFLKRKQPNAKVKITLYEPHNITVISRDAHISYEEKNQLSYVDGTRLPHPIFGKKYTQPYLGVEICIAQDTIPKQETVEVIDSSCSLMDLAEK